MRHRAGVLFPLRPQTVGDLLAFSPHASRDVAPPQARPAASMQVKCTNVQGVGQWQLSCLGVGPVHVFRVCA